MRKKQQFMSRIQEKKRTFDKKGKKLCVTEVLEKKKRVIKVKESKNLWVEFMKPNGFHNSDFLSRLPGKKKV